MRAEGFYWISYGGALPEVARWMGGQWWATGEEIPLSHIKVLVLSGPLEPFAPASGRSRPERPAGRSAPQA